MANDGKDFGVELLSQDGCARARELQIEGIDSVLMYPFSYTMGYALGDPALPYSLTPNRNAIWWDGLGGSAVVIDEDERMCFSYVMNQIKASAQGDERSASLAEALYHSLG